MPIMFARSVCQRAAVVCFQSSQITRTTDAKLCVRVWRVFVANIILSSTRLSFHVVCVRVCALWHAKLYTLQILFIKSWFVSSRHRASLGRSDFLAGLCMEWVACDIYKSYNFWLNRNTFHRHSKMGGHIGLPCIEGVFKISISMGSTQGDNGWNQHNLTFLPSPNCRAASIEIH